MPSILRQGQVSWTTEISPKYNHIYSYKMKVEEDMRLTKEEKAM